MVAVTIEEYKLLNARCWQRRWCVLQPIGDDAFGQEELLLVKALYGLEGTIRQPGLSLMQWMAKQQLVKTRSSWEAMMSEPGYLAALLPFICCSATGELTRREISRWRDVGHYIKGLSEGDDRVLTFRNNRALECFSGCDQLLLHPVSDPPPRPSRDRPATP